MKIKEIKLFGFKSFYGETKFLLNPGITAFVGPNGSGKSNIFDALRWVFGEQSMKALRCEKYEDLIHIPPTDENGLNFTDVAVTIANEDFFPQFGSEFEIKRRFYRNGESEFYLNRVKCRLQDIQALFLNSGTLSYSFLELQEVEKIISGETKEMFDDVSGILKYQERREQTKRRLEQTEQDLIRLEDVINEMERNLRVLKRQTRQAQLYQELKEDYKHLSLYLLKKEENECNEEIEKIKKELNELESRKQETMLEIKKLEEKRQSLKNEIPLTEATRKEKLAQLTKLNQGIEYLEGILNAKENEAQTIELQKERHSATIFEKENSLFVLNNKRGKYKSNLKQLDEELSIKGKEIETLKAELENQSNLFASLTIEIEDKNKIINEKLKEIQIYKNEIAKCEISKLNKEAFISKVNSEKEVLVETLNNLSKEKKDKEKELEEAIGERQGVNTEIECNEKKLKEIEDSLNEIEKNLQAKQEAINERRILIDTLTHRLGKPEGVKEIERKLGGKIAGLLREYLEVQPGYENVIDLCLGEVLDYYFLKEVNGLELVNLPEGRFGFTLNQLEGRDLNIPQKLSDLQSIAQFVQFKSENNFLSHYLNNYFVVEDFEEGLKLALEFPEFGFVLTDGILLFNGAIIVQKGEYGYFKIKQRLQEEKKHWESLKNEMIFISDEKRRLLGEMEKIEMEIEQGGKKLFPLKIKESELTMQLNELKKRINTLLNEEKELNREFTAHNEEINNLNRQIEIYKNKIDEANKTCQQLAIEKESLNEKRLAFEEIINQKNKQLNELLLQGEILRERKKVLDDLISANEKEIENLQNEISKNKELITDERLLELKQTIENLKREISEKREKQLALEAQIPEEEIKKLNRSLEMLYEELTAKQKLQEELQNEIMQLNFKLFQCNHRKEELLKKTKEEFEVDLGDYIPEEIPDAEVRLNEVKERISKLGVINPLSFAAYEEEKKRFDEFLAQRNDIIAARQNLLKSIEELDVRAKERFVGTFSQVKEKFNFVFSHFFEGGEADLILSDPQNPLTSQVDIVVRMKGKRIKRINQLSGGERTLLAVSLLLAFYLVKPAPFCILDEIDAPLDDANVVRFNKFLRDLSQHTQVIIITHNRATMEYADYLYGLTMEKPGQSKVISARLADLENI